MSDLQWLYGAHEALREEEDGTVIFFRPDGSEMFRVKPEETDSYLFITFGQCHTHRLNDVTFDKDIVGVIKCKDYADGRQIAHELTKGIFATSYNVEQIKRSMRHFPRGVAPMNWRP